MLTALENASIDPIQSETGNYSQDELHAMQRAVIKLFDKWGVSDVDAAVLLGGIAAKTYRRWKDGDYGRVNRDLADRMSNLLGIHKALRIIFTNPAQAYGWIKSENKSLGGRMPLAIMMQGGMNDIVRIRRYLDSVRGGW